MREKERRKGEKSREEEERGVKMRGKETIARERREKKKERERGRKGEKDTRRQSSAPSVCKIRQ